jgi:hypothetical protein
LSGIIEKRQPHIADCNFVAAVSVQTVAVVVLAVTLDTDIRWTPFHDQMKQLSMVYR